MKKLKIYNTDGSTNIKTLQGKKGTYKIYYKKQQKPVYIGFSSYNLYKTITRHFQSWRTGTNNGQETISFVDMGYNKKDYYLTYFIDTAKRAEIREKKLIAKHKPKYNTQYNDITPF